jgi:organic hydroperoxide reductase OsmC/OhrA
MSTHTARIAWEGTDAPFTYEEYSRDHRIEWGTGTTASASSAPEYNGNPALPNPEELLVGALSSCHMLTFLAVCARKGFHVARYLDDASGVLEKGANGRVQVTKVSLRPRAEFVGAAPDRETLEKLHTQAHRGCFIANSVACEVVTILD